MNAIKPVAVLIEEGSKKERLMTCFNAIYCFSWHEDLYKLLLGKIRIVPLILDKNSLMLNIS